MYKIFQAGTANAMPAVYKNEQSALDAEEDIAYAILEKGGEPPEMEVWEVDENGCKIREVWYSC